MIGYGPFFSVAFFFVAFFYSIDGSFPLTKIFSGLIFETLILFSCIYLVYRYFNNSCLFTSLGSENRCLKWILFTKFFLLFYLVLEPGFGIFASGEQIRITFLSNNVINKYLIYLWSTLMTVEAVLISRIYSFDRKLNLCSILVIFLEFSYTLLIGSKGSAFLWLLSIVGLFAFSLNSRSFLRKILPFLAFLLVFVFWPFVGFMSNIVNMTKENFIHIVAYRFFLNNDARALTLDYQSNTTGFFEFFTYAFRGLAGKLGYAPIDPPLGNFLFEQYFGIFDGSGSNASLIAISNYYLESPSDLMISLLLSCMVLVMVLLVILIEKMQHSSLKKGIVLLLGVNLVITFSQDILTFPLVLISAIIILTIVKIIEINFNFRVFKHVCK